MYRKSGRVHTRKGRQSALLGEAAHIANLRHELWFDDLTGAMHRHDHIELWLQGGQMDHFFSQDMQRVIDDV